MKPPFSVKQAFVFGIFLFIASIHSAYAILPIEQLPVVNTCHGHWTSRCLNHY